MRTRKPLAELPKNKCGGETKWGEERGRQKWVLVEEGRCAGESEKEGGGKKRMGERKRLGRGDRKGGGTQ